MNENRCPACGTLLEGGVCWRCAEEAAIQAQAEAAQLRVEVERLGGLKAYQDFTLERYDNKAAVELCAAYPNNNLFLWGPAGTGKTHLATALVRRHNGLVVKPQHIYRECRGLADGAEEQAAISWYIRLPHLVIDDLGQEKLTDWSFSILYEVLDGRDMNRLSGLIVTSNLSLSSLAERLGDDRIPSRLSGMCRVVELTGKDRRVSRGLNQAVPDSSDTPTKGGGANGSGKV